MEMRSGSDPTRGEGTKCKRDRARGNSLDDKRDRSDNQSAERAAEDLSQTKDYEFPQWHIEPKKLSTSAQIKRGDFLKQLICGQPSLEDRLSRGDRPTRVNNLINQVNDELVNMRKALQTSNFPPDLKQTIEKQIDDHVQQIKQSYEQALKYDGYLAHQGSASREKSEASLKEHLRDLRAKKEGLEYVKSSGMNNLDDLKGKMDAQYTLFDNSLNHMKDIIINGNKIKQKITYYQIGVLDYRWEVSRSCKKNDFLEAGKWAKKLMDVKLKYEDYLEKIVPGAATQGKKEPNEDAYFSNHRQGCHGVFDGVGRDKGGHRASAIARDSIQQRLSEIPDNISIEGAEEKVKESLNEAHEKIKEAQQSGEYRKMSTTASAVKIMQDGTAIIGNVGDSRVYILRKGSETVEQVTLDDTLLASHFPNQAKQIQQRIAKLESFDNPPEDLQHHLRSRNEIGQCLGGKDYMGPNIDKCQLNDGDTLIIMSDGIYDNLIDQQIAKNILDNNRKTKKAADALVQGALEVSKKYVQDKRLQRPKPDDMTAIVINYSNF